MTLGLYVTTAKLSENNAISLYLPFFLKDDYFKGTPMTLRALPRAGTRTTQTHLFDLGLEVSQLEALL